MIQKTSDLLEILTLKEQKTLKRRLEIANYLLQGRDYEEIRSRLNVGYSTIARVSNWIHVSGESVKRLINDKTLLTYVILAGGALSAYAISGSVDYSDGTLALGIATPFVAKNYISRGGENMRNTIIGLGIGAAMLLTTAVPAFAQTTTSTTGAGDAVKACQATYQSTVKSLRDQVKAGTLTKDAAKTQLKDATTTRNTCVKDAQTAARAAAHAKMEAKKAEMKAKMEAKKAEHQAKKATSTTNNK